MAQAALKFQVRGQEQIPSPTNLKESEPVRAQPSTAMSTEMRPVSPLSSVIKYSSPQYRADLPHPHRSSDTLPRHRPLRLASLASAEGDGLLCSRDEGGAASHRRNERGHHGQEELGGDSGQVETVAGEGQRRRFAAGGV